MVGKCMLKTAERKLYDYQIMLCQIEAYEQDKGIAKKCDLNAFIKSVGRTSDPTAAAATTNAAEPQSITSARGWVRAIENALEENKQDDFDNGTDYGKADMMRDFFKLDCLNTTKTRGTMARMLDILDKANISERAFWFWKKEILQSVVYGAIQEGVLKAY